MLLLHLQRVVATTAQNHIHMMEQMLQSGCQSVTAQSQNLSPAHNDYLTHQ